MPDYCYEYQISQLVWGIYAMGLQLTGVCTICATWVDSQGLTYTVIIPPASMKLKGGYTGITLSVCPSVDRIVSALCLQQYSLDPFHICTSYQTTSEGVSRVMPLSKFKSLKFWGIFKIFNFDFVFFWLGIQYDSMVWVIMRRRGVSSERRRSSCSSFYGNEIFTYIVAFQNVYDILLNIW